MEIALFIAGLAVVLGIAAAVRQIRRYGGFIQGWMDGAPSELRHCKYCTGGVLHLKERDGTGGDGWTRLGPIRRSIRSQVHTRTGGYFQANLANATRCLHCGGFGSYWTARGNKLPDKVQRH